LFSESERSFPIIQGTFSLRVASFCEYQRAFALGKHIFQPEPARFIGAFRVKFPHIAERWWQMQAGGPAPAAWAKLPPGGNPEADLVDEHRFALRVMSLSARGLDDRMDWGIWHDYYYRGKALIRLSGDLYYSAAQLSRRIKVFPQRITAQLLSLDEDALLNDASENAMTYDQVMVNQVMREFTRLSRLSAESFWFFIKTRNRLLHKNEIAGQFGVSLHGLKKRIRNIIQPLDCVNMKEAIELAVRRLHLEDTDPE